MVLDEPTNDLDIETLDLLQELLGDYAGTILLVSHDRDFLDRVATSVIVGDGDGRWVEYAGGYSDMVAQRGYGLAGPLACPGSDAGKADKAAAPERAAPKRKLGFNEKRALETLPGRDREASRRPRCAGAQARRRRLSRSGACRVHGRDKGLCGIARRAGRG